MPTSGTRPFAGRIGSWPTPTAPNEEVIPELCWSSPAGTWSPDGGRIVCSDYSGKDILVVDIATGAASRVAKGNGAIWLDGHTLLVEVS